MDGQRLLKKLGEETIYSAKGHFKACDIRRGVMTGTIWLCAILSVISLLDCSPTIAKGISVVSLIGMIALLIWNEGEGKDYRAKHKAAAEAYLNLHKEIRTVFSLSSTDLDRIKELSYQVRAFDSSDKPEIPWIARKWAQRAISSGKETDNWFIK